MIKNIHKVKHLLSDDDREKLEFGAKFYRQQSNITFKIKSLDESQLVIRAVQQKNAAENYLDKKMLIERTRELFGKVFPELQINVHPIKYYPPPPDIVTSKWIQKMMLEHGVKIVDLVKETGLHKSTLSTLINGGRPISQPIKAMFYYFFRLKEEKNDKKINL